MESRCQAPSAGRRGWIVSKGVEGPDLFGEALLASAALDRLTHGAHFLEISGASFRAEHTKKQATARRARPTA
mgnify:CR=1 FL=1